MIDGRRWGLLWRRSLMTSSLWSVSLWKAEQQFTLCMKGLTLLPLWFPQWWWRCLIQLTLFSCTVGGVEWLSRPHAEWCSRSRSADEHGHKLMLTLKHHVKKQTDVVQQRSNSGSTPVCRFRTFHFPYPMSWLMISRFLYWQQFSCLPFTQKVVGSKPYMKHILKLPHCGTIKGLRLSFNVLWCLIHLVR